jgi:hypothetical protein
LWWKTSPRSQDTRMPRPGRFPLLSRPARRARHPPLANASPAPRGPAARGRRRSAALIAAGRALHRTGILGKVWRSTIFALRCESENEYHATQAWCRRMLLVCCVEIHVRASPGVTDG